MANNHPNHPNCGALSQGREPLSATESPRFRFLIGRGPSDAQKACGPPKPTETTDHRKQDKAKHTEIFPFPLPGDFC